MTFQADCSLPFLSVTLPVMEIKPHLFYQVVKYLCRPRPLKFQTELQNYGMTEWYTTKTQEFFPFINPSECQVWLKFVNIVSHKYIFTMSLSSPLGSEEAENVYCNSSDKQWIEKLTYVEQVN